MTTRERGHHRLQEGPCPAHNVRPWGGQSRGTQPHGDCVLQGALIVPKGLFDFPRGGAVVMLRLVVLG